MVKAVFPNSGVVSSWCDGIDSDHFFIAGCFFFFEPCGCKLRSLVILLSRRYFGVKTEKSLCAATASMEYFFLAKRHSA